MPEEKNIGKIVKEALAEHLGLEVEDVNEGDSLSKDLHMHASELSDFLEALESKGIDTSKIDLITIDTLEDLIESLGDSTL